MAEDMGYDDTYFPSTNLDETDPHLHSSSHPDPSEYILSHSPPSSLLPTDLISTSLDIAAGHEAEREQEIEAVQERLELGDGFQNSALGLLQAEDDVGVRSATEHTNHQGERIIQSLGTHVDPNHPGHLEHIPALATSPSDLPDGPTPTKHYQRSPRTSSHEMSPESERRSETSSEGAQSPMLPIDISTPSTISSTMNHNSIRRMPRMRRKSTVNLTGKVAEAVFFNYGVSVFFGFDESEERDIMEDCEGAGVWMRPQQEDDWDIEEFHYVVSAHWAGAGDFAETLDLSQYDPDAEYPRIYNDMFSKFCTTNSHEARLMLALCSIQVPLSPVQTLTRPCHCAIDQAVHLRASDAGYISTHVLFPERTGRHGTPSIDKKASAQNDRKAVQVEDGCQPHRWYPRYVSCHGTSRAR